MENEELYSIDDFLYWIKKYNEEHIHEKKWTRAEVMSIIAKAMIDFLPDTDTPY